MRENRHPKAQKPVRYRDLSPDQGANSNKQTVGKKDLRSKITKQRKRRLEITHADNNKDVNHSDRDLDESNFCPNYESESHEESGSDLVQSENTSDKSGQDTDKDMNNNGNRVKSVVITAASRRNSKTIDKVRQRITFSGTSEAEEGEISSSDNPANIDSFMEQVNDDQLVQFLKKHQDRIQRVSGNLPGNARAGDDNFLAQNIQRMSLLDRQGDQPVHNSQSEDTIYSRLVKQRNDFENSQRQSKQTGKEICQDKDNATVESQQISTSNDSSLNTSSELEQSNKITDL